MIRDDSGREEPLDPSDYILDDEPPKRWDRFEVGLAAIDVAQALAAEERINLHAVGVYMGALAGIANRIDPDTFFNLPEGAHRAFWDVVDTSLDYLKVVGPDSNWSRYQEYEEFVPSEHPADEVLGVISTVINDMQMHVSGAADLEDRRRAAAAGDVRPHYAIVAEQMSGATPYNEDGIRDVLLQFGQSFNAVAQDWLDTDELLATHAADAGAEPRTHDSESTLVSRRPVNRGSSSAASISSLCFASVPTV